MHYQAALLKLNEYWEDPFTWQVARHVVFAAIVLFFIVLPNFVCRVNDEDFKKFKEKFKNEQVNFDCE